MNDIEYLYYYKQEECLSALSSLKTDDYKAEKIEENVRHELNKYVAYVRQSIKALKKKEITVLFEPIASGYEASPQFRIAGKNETVVVDVISKSHWFGLKRNKLLDESIKIKELKVKQEVSEIEQVQSGEYLFLHIPTSDKKAYKLEIGDFDEETIYPAWLSEEQQKVISFTLKGNEIILTQNPNGKYNVLKEQLAYLEEVQKLEDSTLLRIVKPQSEPDSVDAPSAWQYLDDHACWIGPKDGGKLPDGFEILSSEKEQEVIYDLLKEALKPHQNLWVAEIDEASKGQKWKVNGKTDNKSLTELSVPKTSFAFYLAEIKAKAKNADAYWLQLKESDKQNDDDFSERSPLEYFFDDDVEVNFLDYQGKELSSETGNKAFKVHENHRKAEEKQIVLTDKGKLILPPKETKSLKLKANTYQLERQKDALYALMNAPLPHHQALVRALLKRKVKFPNGFWGEFSSIDEPEWSVLTQPDRAGTDNQREFVRKALASPDFCILEGPPGSGKTTAILELIVQLAKQGKRVLLCASTHVAIDNVLERLITDSELMDLILPIRIGDQARVQENVKDWQLGNIKNKKESNGLYRDEALLLEAANLVCGTTLGILQHPLIKNSSKNRPRQPVFDCLIIDECSKTTFAEFLVPALYARKWVLVGDVRQLSPYVESDWLIANLENLTYKDHKNGGKIIELPKELQQACLTLSALHPYPIPLGSDESRTDKNEGKKNAYNAYVRLPDRVLDEIEEEIEERDQSVYGLDKRYVVCYPPNYEELHECHWEAIIFIKDSDYQSNFSLLSYERFVLNDMRWFSSQHAFRFRAWYERTKGNSGLEYTLRNRGEDLKEPYKIISVLNEALEKTWAGEVAWRITSLYELRMKEQMAEQSPNKKNLTNQIDRREAELERLFPAQPSYKWVRNRINDMRALALPSILSILQEGLPKKWRDKKREDEEKATLQTGFLEEELEPRFVRLQFQHRMHPDISAFPRKQFYNNEALQDPDDMKDRRKWSYNRYDKRAVWVDVDGKAEGNNTNPKEAEILCQELDAFLEWAKENPKGNEEKWEIAVITFYKGQERVLRKKLSKLLGYPKEYWGQYFNEHKAKECNVVIKLNTVDRFQGQEADIVFLSMVQTGRIGFLGSPNRLNVALTRARFQLVVIGKKGYYCNQNNSDDLKALADDLKRHIEPRP